MIAVVVAMLGPLLAQVPPPTPADTSRSVAPLVDRIKASVVSIQSSKVVRRFVPEDPFARAFRDFGGGGGSRREQTQQGLGSGFVVDAAQGIVYTNNHVIAGADEVRVVLADERVFEAQIRGADPRTDVAVVQILHPPKDLRAVRFGDSERVRVGDYVLAIGNPLGLGQTVTMGIVSAKNRTVGKLVDYEDFIQTDAAINQGNSGGPLFNFDGDVIGINSAILNPAMAMNVGFAIPINLAKQIARQLVTKGRVARGYLGVQTTDVSAQEGRRLGNAAGGAALVNRVEPRSPAAAAGLQPNDVIVDVADRRVDSSARLSQIVASRAPGETVPLVAYRGGRRLEVPVTLATNEVLLRGIAVLGMSVEPVAQQELGDLEVRAALRVLGVEGRSVAAGSLREGDIITGIQLRGGMHPATVENLQVLAQDLERGRPGGLILLRGGYPYVLRLG